MEGGGREYLKKIEKENNMPHQTFYSHKKTASAFYFLFQSTCYFLFQFFF